METRNIREMLAGVEDAEVLKRALGALLDRIDSLEAKLEHTPPTTEAGEDRHIVIQDKLDRLREIKHGLTELNERMQRPYIVTPELQAVRDVLDTLSENGVCNSIILEGEPGTGKTQWAYSEVGNELQEGKDSMLIHVRVKETMNAQDLLYSIDDVRRLSDAQAKAQVPEAIREEAAAWKQKIMVDEIDPTENKEYKKFLAKLQAVEQLSESGKDLAYINYVDLGPLGEAIKQSGEGKTVWLVIDEIEKGREELMTGMLDEIENLEFTIGETGTHVKGDKRNLRIVVTTNLEDSDKIPASFRRRSLYHFMEYPSQREMAQIVQLNFPGIDQKLLDYAMAVFYTYHEHSELEKKPSTPELLAWIQVLVREYDGIIPDDIPHKEILLKYKDDQELEIGKLQAEAKEQVETRKGELPHYAVKALQGEPVYRLTQDLNDFRSQEQMASFYAQLENQGISYVTPQFQEKEEYDRYEGGYVTNHELSREFQLVIPGVEYLGNGYYVIPEWKTDVLQEIISKKIEVRSGSAQFTRVLDKSGDFTHGYVDVDGYEAEAYVTKDKKIIIETDYVS